MPDASQIGDPVAAAVERVLVRRRGRAGFAFGLSAYLLWGFVALYFDYLHRRGVTADLILAYRISWCFVFLLLLASVLGQWGEVLQCARSWRSMRTLMLSTVLIAANWYAYIYAVSTHQLSQASLGYYMNPLVNVLLGVLVLGERLRRLQVAAVVIAGAGVTFLTMSSGALPWIAVTLAITFGLYGLLRKTMSAGSVVGLLIETALCTPITLAYIAWIHSSAGRDLPHYPLDVHAWLATSGIVTATPLLLFAAAARRLQLSTLGFMQYVSPTIQLLIAVLAFGEPFTPDRQITFAAIWLAVALFVFDQFRAARTRSERASADDRASTALTPEEPV